MKTEELIDRLARDLAPVRPLPRPERRAAAWLVGAGLYVGLFVVLTRSGGGPTTDLEALLPQLAALVACVVAAGAAFASVVPGYSRAVLAWPLIAGVVWLGMLAIGATWSSGAIAAASRHEWACVLLIVVGAAPLLAALVAMLRRGAPFRPAVTAGLAALAVGALASAGACFWRPHADDAVTLVWHGGAIAIVMAVCLLGARWLLGPSRLSGTGREVR
ncbi:MAG TPA: NrsF family protein [Gammaproteobacteria bacterium]|nr:NrsF family protein [Gammaproteobacteria bacterium]